MNPDFFELTLDKRSAKRKAKRAAYRTRYAGPRAIEHLNIDFTCAHCGYFVITEAGISGVRNRNHCPCCLWSRHLDLHRAGDRLAACKGIMRPVGVTLKRSRNKYSPQKKGELMLVHRCVECGKASLNRIAADDHAETIYEVYLICLEMDPQTKARLVNEGIEVLETVDMDTVQAQLFGQRALPIP